MVISVAGRRHSPAGQRERGAQYVYYRGQGVREVAGGPWWHTGLSLAEAIFQRECLKGAQQATGGGSAGVAWRADALSKAVCKWG